MEFLKETDVKFEENKSLTELSYMRLGGIARVIASPSCQNSFLSLVLYLHSRGIPFKVVGNMSNVLPSDCLYDGVIVRTSELRKIRISDGVVEAEAGCRLSLALWKCAKHGLSLAEELFMIPATVGGAVFGNAGAHGRCIADVFLSALLFDPVTKTVCTYFQSDMKFAYRASIMKKRKLYLLSARFRTKPCDFLTVKENITRYAKIRRAAQPTEYPSLGSIFKRHEEISAGYYIDRAGLKGMRIGGAMISDKHAGFIVNTGGATAAEVKALISQAKASVKSKFGVMLEEEIEIM